MKLGLLDQQSKHFHRSKSLKCMQQPLNSRIILIKYWRKKGREGRRRGRGRGEGEGGGGGGGEGAKSAWGL